MIYRFIRGTQNAFVEAPTANDAQGCVQNMQLHSAYETWNGAISSLFFLGTMQNVQTFDRPLSQQEVRSTFLITATK